MDKAERSTINSANALVRVGREGGTAVSAAARQAFMMTFDAMVSADVTDPAERERRASAFRRAHFKRLAAKSAAARRNRADAPEVRELRAIAAEAIAAADAMESGDAA